jgi:cytochrome c5
MKVTGLIVTWVLAVVATLSLAAAQPRNDTTTIPVARSNAEADTMRIEGEKRFRANCNRCHAAPHKFPPRMMATIVRHMRVRATITDEDMHYILYYMTQ